MKKFLSNITIFIILFLFSSISYAEVIEKLKVVGNKRISQETIKVFGDIKLNTNYDEKRLNKLIHDLYQSNYFSEIKINIKDGTLEIFIKENPIISTVKLEGIKNKAIIKGLREGIILKERVSYVESYFLTDLNYLKAVLRNIGYYFVEIEPFKKEKDNNTIDLIYKIKLGEKAKIKKIIFLGDKKFKDKRLKSIITSEESKPWKFISKKKYLNEKRSKMDERLLLNYYKNKGYYEAKVLSSNALFTEGGGFKLIFNIDGGKKYKIGNFIIKSPGSSEEKYFSKLNKSMEKLKGKNYSLSKVKRIIDKYEELKTIQELQFIEAELVETIKGNTIDITLNLYETKKIYVERINVFGNSITDDHVVRSQMISDEGDPFNKTLLTKSINNLKALRIFESVDYKVEQGSTKDKKILNIFIEEKPTGEISAGAGVGTSGSTIGFAIKENNYLGRGIKLDASLNLSEESIRGIFAVDNPNFKFSGNSLHTSVHSQATDKMSTSGYKSTLSGISLGSGFEQWEDIYLLPTISTNFESLDTTSDASTNLKKQDGEYFTTKFTYNIIRDKRNQSFQPTDGDRIVFKQSLPVYADSPTILNGLEYVNYYSPIDDITTSFRFFSRAVNGFGDEDVRISERVFVPSKYLRGFEAGRIGPVDSGEHVGGNLATAVGFNTSFPNMFKAINADLSFFFDTANVWGVDYKDQWGESSKIRSSFGTSVDWLTPIGPLNFSLSQAITKKATDLEESFRFDLGTTF